MPQIIFFDIETDSQGIKQYDIGAVGDKNEEFHADSHSAFLVFLKNTEYLCGHNIFEHDLKYVKEVILQSSVIKFIDTLYLSPLLFPSRPYHAIGKQYKIVSEEEQNNPLLDSKLARDLFYDEVNAFNKLDERLKGIFYALLFDKKEFKDFFRFVGYMSESDCVQNIKGYFGGKICENVDLIKYITEAPIELAYSFALINAENQ